MTGLITSYERCRWPVAIPAALEKAIQDGRRYMEVPNGS